MKKSAKSAGIVCLLFLFCLYTWMFKIEPTMLKTEEITIGEGEKAFTIVQISDLHVKEEFSASALNRIARQINSLDADLLVFTGDLYDNYSTYSSDEDVLTFLQSLQADQKIAIYGNRDIGGEAVTIYKELMEAGGFTVLVNDSVTVNIQGTAVQVAGLDDGLMGVPAAVDVDESAKYHILLMHEPDLADEYAAGYDLILSGHSHGGQIRLPYVRQLLAESTGLAQKYWDGLYTIEDTTLYVSSGIGTTHISARLGVIPELARIEIRMVD